MRIVITRTVPVGEFDRLSGLIRERCSGHEFKYIVQQSVKDDISVENSECCFIPDGFLGKFRNPGNSFGDLRSSKADTMVILSNNDAFSGYGKWVRLGVFMGCRNIYLLNRNNKLKKTGFFHKVICRIMNLSEYYGKG